MAKYTVRMEIEVEVEALNDNDAYEVAESEILDRGLYEYIRNVDVYCDDADEEDEE